MKIKGIFEKEIFGDETVMVSLDSDIFNGIIRANETASFIIDCMREDTTPQVVISKLSDKYNISLDLASRSVNSIISKLKVINVLEE